MQRFATYLRRLAPLLVLSFFVVMILWSPLLAFVALAQDVTAEATAPEEHFLSVLMEHWQGVLAVFVALYTLALAVARLTPTPRDNELLGSIGKFFDKILPGGLTKGITK